MRVFCKHCEHEKNVDECWCVIDTRKKERYFECKVKCIVIVPRVAVADVDPQVEKEYETRDALEIDTTVDDWMDRIPRQTWMDWFKSLFGLSGIRYVKIKLN
jgi:hypothetical protein